MIDAISPPNDNNKMSYMYLCILCIHNYTIEMLGVLLQDDLNDHELELSCGTHTSDLNTFLGEVLQERESERWSIRSSYPWRMHGLVQAPPRHSAILYTYDDAESTNGIIRLVGDREMSVSSADSALYKRVQYILWKHDISEET